ncbi:hypothetical protein MTO96_046501 [Rhipicephalus appendiculatus]
MGEQELEEVAVGTRVSCDGHYGVVRYCGPVVDTKGEIDAPSCFCIYYFALLTVSFEWDSKCCVHQR